jgi:hypothetical protein
MRVPAPSMWFWLTFERKYFDRIGGAWGWLVYRERPPGAGGGK